MTLDQSDPAVCCVSCGCVSSCRLEELGLERPEDFGPGRPYTDAEAGELEP